MRKIKICVRKSDNLVLYAGSHMELSQEKGIVQEKFRDPALTPTSAAIYEVNSLPQPFGKAFYTYNPLTSGFEPTALGTEKITQINKSSFFLEAQDKLINLGSEVSEVADWLISHLLSKGVIIAGDIPPKVRNWRKNYAATKR